MTFLIATAILVGLIVLGIPVGFALGLAGVLSLMQLLPFQVIANLAQSVVKETAGNPAIMTIPMFVLMAEFLGAGDVTRDLMLACNRTLRRIRGGMAMACILAGTLLAAASGSSTATAATITRAAYPTMKLAGYSPALALGSIAISGTLAMMIPPSIAFVVYGLMTENSIGHLFMAGIIPGLITSLGYIFTIFVVIKIWPALGPTSETEERLANTTEKTRIWPVGLLVCVIFGALYGGIATPTEISALGALGALLVCLALRRLDGPKFVLSVGNALRTTSMIITIIFCAHLFGFFVSFSKITDAMLVWIGNSGLSPTAVMLTVVAVYVVLGMIMDQTAILILTAPITAPLMVGLGYDPIWWGVIIVKTAEIGMVTPPVGLNAYVTSNTSGASLKTVFAGLTPFLVMEFLVLGLLLAFPGLTLLLT